jgi:hypothetical protein
MIWAFVTIMICGEESFSVTAGNGFDLLMTMCGKGDFFFNKKKNSLKIKKKTKIIIFFKIQNVINVFSSFRFFANLLVLFFFSVVTKEPHNKNNFLKQ